MTENEFWNIDELVALTDKVQTGEVDYNEKKLKFQYCELTEGEEPKSETSFSSKAAKRHFSCRSRDCQYFPALRFLASPMFNHCVLSSQDGF